MSREGAHRFTTVRVAEEAGVSVGSLYQYFPSKEALLFRLQTDEWQETWSVLEEILNDERLEPLSRLRKVILVFFRSERQEASLRVALSDASVFIRDAAETRAFAAQIRRRVRAFLAQALPHVATTRLSMASELLVTSMSAVPSASPSARCRKARSTHSLAPQPICTWLTCAVCEPAVAFTRRAPPRQVTRGETGLHHCGRYGCGA